MKKIYLLVVVGFISAFLVACGDAEVSPTENAADNNEATTNNEEPEANESNEEPEGDIEEEEVEEELSVGDSIDFEGMTITLNSARIEPGGDFDEPSEDQFLVANLTIENGTDEEQPVSSIMNIELKDDEGYAYTTTILTEGTKGQLDGSIQAGDQMRGEIPFDVAKSDVYHLNYSDPFKSGKAVWVIPEDALE